MTIYKGSQKIGSLYKGGTKIGKVYKGSTLVYSGGEEIIPITKVNSQYWIAIVGPVEADKTYASNSSDPIFTLQSVNGIIGGSGSTIVISGAANFTLSFNRQFTDSKGRLFYVYNLNMGYVDYCSFISPKQKVGDKVPTCLWLYVTPNSNVTGLTCTTISGYSETHPLDTNTIIDYYTYRA